MSAPRKLLVTALHKLYGLYFATIFLLCSITTLILLAITPGETRRRAINRAGARMILRLTGTWPEVTGLEHLPEESSVVVANHASYLDGVLLTAVLPHRYQFVIKREVTSVPLMHFYLRRTGAQFVERYDAHGGARDTRRILQAASTGASLAFFPEGTFRSEPGLRRFHNGAFTIAVRNNLVVLPVSIHGTRRVLPGNRLLPRPGRLRVVVNPGHQTVHGHTNVKEILQRCRDQILEQLDEPDHQHEHQQTGR
ncbi:MAG: lysophospholipid acyltransferase family protein [Gammaproteobacteria bacterium]|jgi:1-acyl-sn-glycerol-3-phosphate acyltransferase|nr:lysophospholipid acyltransferase family protein [Gammaproteobacteria bacterium]MDP6616300.1 lysophospholipid acyltransferase family protein [Gammaproteobacteria bacterium]MDP6694014.1 lysophospholipid acyltransferase family protein [Gammaproteobacteria bacterium]MDP7041372.1 lysophospholipid acyltransferase family protein [Gammaproteobacteria bacterium]